MINNKNIILVVGGILLLIGILKPNFIGNNSISIDTNSIKVVEPVGEDMESACKNLTKILQKGGPSDALRLASLYSDISDLIALDAENEIIKTTEQLRQANSLSGILLNLDIKGKYDGLAAAANTIVVLGIGDDDVAIDPELRDKAVNTFRTLAWACRDGSK